MSGQSVFGTLSSTGWLGEHPGDGKDFAFLMLYGLGDGVASPRSAQGALREVLQAWGMREGVLAVDPVIDGTPVTVVVEGIQATVTGLPGVTPVRPTSQEWADVACARRQVFLGITSRIYTAADRSDTALSAFFKESRTIDATASLLVPVTAAG
ncbi:DUF5949 family protein [Streptomyces sp. WM6378]|uniref:DUF5949 family protein n=1 Tax=Streptomyces sp. WM6378 TaxID=1415557 RepID=UPI000B060530|nr:DUF5949 family protein [Streptomyces sp. WM6378]